MRYNLILLRFKDYNEKKTKKNVKISLNCSFHLQHILARLNKQNMKKEREKERENVKNIEEKI